jgi:hypothetical protein
VKSVIQIQVKEVEYYIGTCRGEDATHRRYGIHSKSIPMLEWHDIDKAFSQPDATSI